MHRGKLLISLAFICFDAVGVTCIVSKGGSNGAEEKIDAKKIDNVPAQSIDRDYIAGLEENYGHGGYGLSAHANYGFLGGHEDYGVHEEHKPHVHHLEDHHHHHHHKHHDYAYHKALAIKGLLVPLAGVALLGAAAAFVSNPILLQLGVISSSSLGRRKRDTKSGANPFHFNISRPDQVRLNEIKLLERFMVQVPKQEIRAQEKKMFADYLSCSGMTADNLCLERLACELHSREGRSMPMEANVLTIVVNEILGNEFIPEKTKIRLSEAIQRGNKDYGCEAYKCDKLEKEERITKSYQNL